MPSYRIFRMKDQPRQSFKWAPHTSGETAVKLKDYVESGSIEAENAYEAWQQLRNSDTPLEIGDILETELGGIKICKYVGFEDAKWILPEAKSHAEGFAAKASVPESNGAGL